MNAVTVWISHPNRDEACRLVESLVEEGVAACGHVFSPGVSIYRWKGKIVRETEVMILLKTSEDCGEDLILQVKKKHPYEVPEIIFQSIDGGGPEYLAWISESVFPPAPPSQPSGEE